MKPTYDFSGQVALVTCAAMGVGLATTRMAGPDGESVTATLEDGAAARAFRYNDFGYSRGLVRLGRLSRIPDAFRQPGPVTVTVEAGPARD